MSVGGWFTMLVSVGFVVTLFIWCIWRVLSDKGEREHIHGMEDIERGGD